MNSGFSRLVLVPLVVFGLVAGAATARAQQKSARRHKPERASAAETPPAAPSESPSFQSAIEHLHWRELGPAIMGGRIDDLAVADTDPQTVYVGTASGGVWKTANQGVTWTPLFDKEPVSSIGAISVAPSDPSILWVGTGEANNRQSSSWGNGVYKSMDAGKTWTNMGLAQTEHIGRIAINPANPDVVFVAAQGRLWGPSKERGVYKTTDGGKSWSLSLFVNEDTGVSDLAMDPQSPDTLYAAAYERRRTPFGFDGGGPSSAIYKTTDGGATWKKLTKGLPYAGGGDTGRIGLAIYRRNPHIVYALVQHAKGGIYRSDDKGESWTKMSDTNPRPSYYSQVRVDPNNDLRIWVLGAPVYYSEDGGKTFVNSRGFRIHGDYHALWIDPANSNHMIIGTDGGIHFTWDNGRNWDYINTIPLGQFYEIGLDMRTPWWVCGGLQDNGSWCGPSATANIEGVTNDDWFRVDGGDGFYAAIDPTDPATVYTESQDGFVSRRDTRTTEARFIRPLFKEGDPPYRFQWNSPIIISSHDHNTIYYGGNFLFKSTDRGDSWTILGGDLTTGVDRNKLPILGKVPDKDTLSRADGVEWYPCITTIAESPLSASVLWVGTDDGNLQVTRDGGKTWNNVAGRVPGVPQGTYVSRVVASRSGEGAAYVTFDGHRSGDFHVYLFMTSDFGDTWTSISHGIPPDGGTLHVIREHPQNSNLLFAGTEFGAYVSFDRGAGWLSLNTNLPTVPVDDIQIHPRDDDLVLATHGRSIWVLDDISPLLHLDQKVLASDLHLFSVRPAIEWRMYNNKGNTGSKWFMAQNPPYGALIQFYLKSAPPEKEPVKISILDADGKLIREIHCAAPKAEAAPPRRFGAAPCEPQAGINRTNWDLRYSPWAEPTPQQLQAMAAGFGFGPRGPLVDPGNYTVKIAFGKEEQTQAVEVRDDPRISVTPAARAARHSAIMKLYDLGRTSAADRTTITGLKASLSAALESWAKPGAPPIPENIQKAAQDLAKQVDQLHDQYVPPELGLGNAGPPLIYTPPPLPQRVGRLMGAIEDYTDAPTSQQITELDTIAQLVAKAHSGVRKLVDEDLVNLNKMMNDAGIPHITAGHSGAERRTSRAGDDAGASQ
ncbi:MAG TPA: hypothetical protein VLW54_11440 [Candidatus Acidoferrales bacterium]|nr:hypothetical protein [Candidatus Acidoferrales bacterium]